MLIVLLAVVLALGAVLITSLANGNPEIERQRKTLDALAQAKQALIAWAVVQGDVGTDSFRRPGTLPCPDKNFFGSSDSGNASGSCSTAGGTSLGRFPWKSLGTDRLRDAHGESLWYAVSDSFRRPNDLNNNPINSDTKGTLLLYATDGSTLLTPSGEELAAIVFAPGPPLPGQDRAAQPDAASSYLEAFSGKNNASAAGPFVMGPAKDAGNNVAVNDLAVGISARELIEALERRALNEAQNALEKHSAATGHYPHPALPAGANCTTKVSSVKLASIPTCDSDPSTCFGRLPEDVISPYVASWFLQNAWGRVMIYAINDGGAGCATLLKVDGKQKNYVLIAPGSVRNGQSRPSTLLSDYLNDPANTDAWSADPNFSTPTGNSNDQLRAKP